MTPPRLLVIDPAIVWPEDLGVREIASGWPGEVVVLHPGLAPSEVPGAGTPYDADAVVVMGSRASVHDDRPWLARLGEWLDPILDGRVERPLLGICFGHQLIAHRAGAAVGRVHPDGDLERGVQESVVRGSTLVPDRERIHVIVSHGEDVKATPTGFRVVGSRRNVPIDALEHERLPVFGVQFHPEARREFLALRDVPAGPSDEAAFRDQAELLERFRRLALARAARTPDRGD